jgi:hypothetical protein
MKVDKILLVEGAANDVRSALTLVGVNQRVFFFPALPFRVQLRAIIMMTDEVEGSDGRHFEGSSEAQISINVIDPKGASTFSLVDKLQFPKEKKWVDLPLLAAVVSDITLSGNEHGIYVVEVKIKASEHEEHVSRIPVYVTPQADTSDENGLSAFSGTALSAVRVH